MFMPENINKYMIADLLSPYSYFFANSFPEEKDIKVRIDKVFRLYRIIFYEDGMGICCLNPLGLYKEGYINNVVWTAGDGYFRYDIEDNLLAKAGVCRENSIIAASIFKLMGVKNYQLAFIDHVVTWAPNLDIIYSNGEIFNCLQDNLSLFTYKYIIDNNKTDMGTIISAGMDGRYFTFLFNNINIRPDKLSKKGILDFINQVNIKMGKGIRFGMKRTWNEVNTLEEINRIIEENYEVEHSYLYYMHEFFNDS